MRRPWRPWPLRRSDPLCRPQGPNVKTAPCGAVLHSDTLLAQGAFRLLHRLVQRQGQELRVFRGEGHLVEDFGGLVVGRGVFALGGDGGLNLDEFLGNHRADHFDGDLAAVVEDALGGNHPLPHLRTGDFGGGGVFHQVVDGHAAVAGQPGTQVVDADVDVVAQAGFGDGLLRLEVEPLGRAELSFDLLFPLVGLVAEDLNETPEYDQRKSYW